MKVATVTAYNHLFVLTMDFLDNFQNFWPDEIESHLVLVNGGCQAKIDHPFVNERIDLKANTGFCKVLNAGLRAVLGRKDIDFIFFVGNDSFPSDSTWLPRVLDLQRRTDAWMVCPANDRPGMRIHWASYEKEHPDHWEALFYPSIAWLMPFDKFKRVGLLDERFPGTGMFADNDYCARIKLEGGKIVVSKDILIRHICGAEGSAIGTQSRDMEICRAIFEEKWKR